jgi:hypothetical protein
MAHPPSIRASPAIAGEAKQHFVAPATIDFAFSKQNQGCLNLKV